MKFGARLYFQKRVSRILSTGGCLGLCPGWRGSLSEVGVSVQEGCLHLGGLCSLGGLCLGSLSRGASIPGGSLSGGLCLGESPSQGGLCRRGVSVHGVSLVETPRTVMSGWYASYLNAFLL